MAVKITSTGIDAVTNMTVEGQTDISGQINYDNMPSGSVIQSKFINSNYDWGSVGHSSVWAGLAVLVAYLIGESKGWGRMGWKFDKN